MSVLGAASNFGQGKPIWALVIGSHVKTVGGGYSELIKGHRDTAVVIFKAFIS